MQVTLGARQPPGVTLRTHDNGLNVLLTRHTVPRRHATPTIRTLAARPNTSENSRGRSLACRAAAEPDVLRDTGSAGPRLQPSDRVLKLWRKANAVCFDVDCEFCRPCIQYH